LAINKIVKKCGIGIKTHFNQWISRYPIEHQNYLLREKEQPSPGKKNNSKSQNQNGNSIKNINKIT
jgi:hypothetical protein